MDVKTTFPDQGTEDYSPINYDGKFEVSSTEFALGTQSNPAVKSLAVLVFAILTKLDDLGMPTFAPNRKFKEFGFL